MWILYTVLDKFLLVNEAQKIEHPWLGAQEMFNILALTNRQRVLNWSIHFLMTIVTEWIRTRMNTNNLFFSFSNLRICCINPIGNFDRIGWSVESNSSLSSSRSDVIRIASAHAASSLRSSPDCPIYLDRWSITVLSEEKSSYPSINSPLCRTLNDRRLVVAYVLRTRLRPGAAQRTIEGV